MSGAARLHLWAATDRAGLLAALDGPPMGACPPALGERLAVVCAPAELPERLDLARHRLAGLSRPRLFLRDKAIHFASGAEPGQLAFLYPGEGSQRIGMLDAGRKHLAPVAAWLGALDDTYARAGAPSPTELIFPATPPDDAGRAAILERLFDIGHGAQLCTVANLALTQVLDQLGLSPDRVLGHSNGEHAAIMAACLDLERQRAIICDWLRRASLAGRALGDPHPAQRMAAISAIDADRLAALLAEADGRLFLAMDNCPHQQVVGGDARAVAALAPRVAAAGGICGELPFNRAYHTPLFSGWAATLAAQYDALPLAPPRWPVHSCLTAAAMPTDPAAIRRQMAGQWTATLRLRDAITALYADGVRTFIEVGADAKLTAFVEDSLRGRPHLAVSCVTAQRDEVAQLPHLLAALHAHGLEIDPARLDRLAAPPPSPIVPLPLPPAPDHLRPAEAAHALIAAQRRLIDDAQAGLDRVAAHILADRRPTRAAPPSWPLLGPVAASPAGLSATRHLSLAGQPFLADHALGRAPARPLPVLSFTTSLALAAEAGRAVLGPGGALTLDQVEARAWLALEGGSLDLTVAARRLGGGVEVGLGGTPPAFRAQIHRGGAVALPPTGPGAGAAPPRRWTPQRFYGQYAFHGPSFRALTKVEALDATGIAAELVVTDPPGLPRHGLQADPALLDCAGQLVALWLLDWHGLPATIGVFPFRARRVTLLAPPPPPGSPIRCTGSLALEDGVRSRASFVFHGPAGLIAVIDDLEQRVMEVPAMVADHVFGPPEHMAAHHPDPVGWAEALDLHGGIWARLLAHQNQRKETDLG